MWLVERVGPPRQGGRKGEAPMSEHENTELVQRAYGSFRDGDIPAVLDSLSEDVQ